MNRFGFIMLLSAFLFAAGCGSSTVPLPKLEDLDQARIKETDRQVDEAESKQGGNLSKKTGKVRPGDVWEP